MAYTKQQLIDAFCDKCGFDAEGAETKGEFITRKQNEWAREVAVRELQRQVSVQAEANADGVDIV